MFFWVDRFIFYHKYKSPIWEIIEKSNCYDCGEEARCYRLLAYNKYNKINDTKPQFRCEECSEKKFSKMELEGVFNNGNR